MASTTILSDNGASSGSAGYKITAGNDGVLILQTTTSGGTATNAVFVDTSQNVGVGATPQTGWYTNRTRIFSITGASGVATANYANAVGENLYNMYFNAAGQVILQQNGYAGVFNFNNDTVGGWAFKVGASGSAGANTPITTVAAVNAYGIGVGTATPSSGIGIAFPATQVSSSDANTLDDYEEGTWTATINGGSSVTNTTGYYTKIGNVVYFSFYSSSFTSTAVRAQISGLPFAASNSNYYFPTVYSSHNTWTTGATNGFIQQGASYFDMITNGTTAYANGASGTAFIMVSGFYRV